MKAALVVLPVCPDVAANQAAILRMALAAADAGTALVLFPEAALTGLINNDDPAHDLPLGQPIPGPMTVTLAELACERGIWIAVGLLEQEEGRLYDTAVLLSPTGEIALKYRRIHPGWHGPQADPAVYGRGSELPVAETPLGRFAFLICGDLFLEELVQRLPTLAPDWLLLPFARSFADGSQSRERWDSEIEAEYAEQVRRTGVTTLLVNYLDQGLPDDHCFGGALVVAGDGRVIERLPPGQAGILLVDLPKTPGPPRQARPDRCRRPGPAVRSAGRQPGALCSTPGA